MLGHFRKAGYRTAAIGKIHCPAGWVAADADVCLEAYGELSPSGTSPYDEYLRARGLEQDRDDGFLQEQGANPGGQSVGGAGHQPWIMQVSLPRPLRSTRRPASSGICTPMPRQQPGLGRGDFRAPLGSGWPALMARRGGHEA